MTRSPEATRAPADVPGRRRRLARYWRLIRRRFSELPPVPVWLLLATVVFAAPLDAVYPTAGLDPSWEAGLNLARQRRLRFGPELVFTYGPWGFLDHPEAVSRFNLVTGTLFAVLACAAAWLAVYLVLRARLGQLVAAITGSLLVMLCALTIEPSALLFAAMMLALLGYLDRGGPPWIPAAAAAGAALLIQVKFSEGAVLALGSLCAAAFAGRWRRLVEAGLALVGGTLLAWLLAGQSIADLPAWVREMRQVAVGYTDAMSLEARPNVLPYLLIVAICAIAVGYLVRLARDRPARITAGIAVLVLLALYLGFREGTGRHGPGMQKYFYLYALPVLVWAVAAVSVGRRVVFRLGVVAVVVLLAGSSWSPLSPADAMSRWGDQLQLSVDSRYQAQRLQQARLVAQQHYAVSGPMRAALAGAPVTVDPWEATLAWAYGLDWKPVPAFQSYVAYTGKLDALNAAALVNAQPNRLVLRAAGLNSIDGRNRLWDPPRYLLAELCDYRPVLSDSRWLLLRKAEVDRCGAAQPLATVRVSAGQQLSVPVADPGSLVTMSFRASSPGLLVRLGRALDKSFHPLEVTADGTRYRLPRALADGPLIARLPASTGWPGSYGGGTGYRTVSFSEPGEVQFSIIPLS
ncbi:MAG TPA: hypothetical protein VFU36_10860 [Jatrophihabitans sp.]|nr:hypothetical protein [Jatrophihabitans sp.]